jgi:hypothetical protein
VLIFDLVSKTGTLRKIEKEIGISNTEIQASSLMAKRKELLKQIRLLRAEIAQRMVSPDDVKVTLFRTVCSVLNLYCGRGVGESLLLTFERESGLGAIEIVSYPEIFIQVINSILGAKAAGKVKAVLVSEIGREFGIQFSKRTSLSETMHVVTKKPAPLRDSRGG